jgi:heme-degrading monooxygenase HmoA
MIAKIYIKRKFKKDSEEQIASILNRMRAAAMDQGGYISGETLVSCEDPQTMTVIATWQNLESWHKWKASEARKQMEAMLEVFQIGPTVYEEYIAGFAPKK